MPKYYFTSLAGRPMRLSGREIKFDVCSLQGGKAVGIYEATDAGDIAALDDAVRGRRGVREISVEEFDSLKKKATTTRPLSNTNVSKPRVVKIPLLPEMAMLPGGAASVESTEGKPKPVNPEENLLAQPPISKLVRVERVNPPRPFASADEKAVKATKRAERAKIRVARKSE